MQSEILVLRLVGGHPFVASYFGMFEVRCRSVAVCVCPGSEWTRLTALVAQWQTDECVFLMLEYCPGGELYSRMKSVNRFSEDEAKFYFCELVVALRDLQDRVSNRCLKIWWLASR